MSGWVNELMRRKNKKVSTNHERDTRFFTFHGSRFMLNEKLGFGIFKERDYVYI